MAELSDSMTVAFLKALRVHEIGSGSPYRISFAQKGDSGASFGFMQADLHTGGSQVTDCFRDVLLASAMPAADVENLVERLSGRLESSPLSASEEAAVNAALNAPAGRRLIDGLDEYLAQQCMAAVTRCIDVAHQGGRRIDPRAQLAMGLWINMSGPPTTLLQWVRGGSVTMALPVPPPDEYITLDEVIRYLEATTYYTSAPMNIEHLREAVAAGAVMLDPNNFMAMSGLGWFIFEQLTGRFLLHGPSGDDLWDVGYSGSERAGGINDPARQCEKLIGPLPRGLYRVGSPIGHPTPLSFPLSPDHDADTCGRDGFLIHGGCRDGSRNASTGCIILSIGTRQRISASPVTSVLVVGGQNLYGD